MVDKDAVHHPAEKDPSDWVTGDEPATGPRFPCRSLSLRILNAPNEHRGPRQATGPDPPRSIVSCSSGAGRDRSPEGPSPRPDPPAALKDSGRTHTTHRINPGNRAS